MRHVARWGFIWLLAATAASAQTLDAGTRAPQLDALEARATRVRQLAEGSLDAAIDPQGLFDVSLVDESAIQLEARRLSALLSVLDAGSDDPLWSARLALDRARLAFLSLSPETREARLQELQARAAAPSPETLERQRLLEAAQQARTEAERAVAGELSALLALRERLDALAQTFKNDQAELATQRDEVLGWQRRLKELAGAAPEELDPTYDALRAALRRGRDALSTALATLSSGESRVPPLPPAIDLTANDAPADRLLELRAEVSGEVARLRDEEQAQLRARATALVDAITTLNQERLALLPRLSDAKRAQITGFTVVGLDQARSEARHLVLLLRYHQRVGADWLEAVRAGRASISSSVSGAAVLAQLILLLLGFLWLRARTPRWLLLLERRQVQRDRAERLTEPSLSRQLAGVLTRIHPPLEWLLFLSLLAWVLPPHVRGVLEVELLFAIGAWVAGGGLAVRVVDALATELVVTRERADALRLRSLRLVGTTVVAFGIVLFISSRLVGQGTIFGWVLLASWVAIAPVFLILVRWWRPTVLARLERARKPNALERWVLAHREGWASFPAAMVGALALFVTGTWRTVRAWASSFAATRRASAWLFRRELDRRGEDGQRLELLPLRAARLDALDPSRPSTHLQRGPGDEVLARIATRVAEQRPGLIALVGAQGMGKTTLLERLAAAVNGAVVLRPQTEAIIAATTATPRAPLVLLDDMQTFVKPIIGGLAGFDAVINRLREDDARTVWVLAFDSTVWPFLARARDARPLFDEVHHLEPWTEEQLTRLLDQRAKEAACAPSYEQLLDGLPGNADDLERLDVLHARAAGYMRMLWDHVRGNPGLALEAWRRALGEDAHGGVHVRPLQEPDTAMLERLPDGSLFVLRAVLQLAPATVVDVAHATRLSPENVASALRFGEAQGIFLEREGRYYVTWRWMRAVLWQLERRHLLVNA